MNTKSKAKSIFRKIHYQTKKGNIEWRELAEGVFIADIGKINFRLQEDFFGIYSSGDNLLESLDNKDMLGEEFNITGLYEYARNNLKKVYDRLDELDKVLDNFI